MMINKLIISKAAIAITIVFAIITVVSLYLLVKYFIEIFKKIRSFKGFNIKSFRNFFFSLCYMAFLLLGIYYIPKFLFNSSWNEMSILYTHLLTYSIFLICTFIIIFGIDIFIINFFPMAEEKPYFLLVILSVFSGISYALLMLIINSIIDGKIKNQSYLLLYFIIAFIGYIFGMKIVRLNVAKIANNLVFNKRIEIVSKILKTPFEKLEIIGNERIYSCLNNDTEVISNTVGIFTIGITCIVSFVCCFAYMAFLNIKAFIITVGLLVGFGIVIYLFNKMADKFFNQVRDIQNTFFKFINDLLNGFKELSINKDKSHEFKKDMFKSCEDYRSSRLSSEVVSTNVYFTGELMAISILGCLVFLFPILFKDVKGNVLMDYVFLLLYLKGPLDNILNLIPRFLQARVSFQRINKVLKQIEQFEEDVEHLSMDINNFSINLNKVEYTYKDNFEENFKIGPIDAKFSKGELVFITGGNGSGKSTLVKLITGLYEPDDGKIFVNDMEVKHRNISEYISAVFSDFYIFKTLYGIDCSNKRDDINKYLNILGLEKKVSIKNGKFNTIRLSTGQKKRLALLMSYLEDKPIYVFDEWAADQDPEFRKFFYFELLPELKQRGKCIIAITHDDRYFNVADKIIKMESGNIISTKGNSNQHDILSYVD